MEKTYKVGDRFEKGDEIFGLVFIELAPDGYRRVGLVNWSDARVVGERKVLVRDSNAISLEDVQYLMGRDWADFRGIEGTIYPPPAAPTIKPYYVVETAPKVSESLAASLDYVRKKTERKLNDGRAVASKPYAGSLADAFDWAASPEGFDFWHLASRVFTYRVEQRPVAEDAKGLSSQRNS